jgi:hypothetical protein
MTTVDEKPKQAGLLIGNVIFPAGVRRYASVYLLAVLALLFLASPFLDDLEGGELVEAILLTGTMLCSILTVGGKRRSLLLAVLLIIPACFAKWVNYFFPSLLAEAVYMGAATAFFLFVVGHLIRFILRASYVNANVLCAGLSGYLLLGMLWVPAYRMVTRVNPDAFHLPAGASLDGFSAFYFSFITLCTVGYGDLTPASKVARMLAVAEAITGLFYVTVLISRLVAIFSTTSEPVTPDEPSTPTPPKPQEEAARNISKHL